MPRETFPSLTGLRFLLALWISGYHFVLLFGTAEQTTNWFISMGNIRVDVFFVLSGFVLAHVYAGERGKFDYRTFLIARAARLYPLHLLGLAILALGIVAAVVMGRGAEAQDYTLPGLLGSMLMLQAWSFPEASRWNFPTWALSAEAFAYLLFPVYLWLARAFAGRAWIFALLALGCVFMGDLAWPLFSPTPFSSASVEWGAIRGALVFMVGFSARLVFGRMQLGGVGAMALMCAGGAVTTLAGLSDWPLAIVAFGAALFILGIAAFDRAQAPSPLATPVMQLLGAWSYGLFVLHVPLFVIGGRILEKLGWSRSADPVSAAMLLGLATLAGWAAHRLVEEPARRAIRAWGDKRLPVDATTPFAPANNAR